jgi:hypothetical protein
LRTPGVELPLECAAVPLDFVRRSALQRLTRSPLLTRLLARRDTRIALIGGVQVVVLFGLTVRWPVAVYLLGPVCLGVLHVAADLRYLVLRLPLPRSLLAASALLAVALTVARLCLGVHAIDATTGSRLELAMGLSWIAVSLALRPGWRRGKGVLVGAVFLAMSLWLLACATTVNLLVSHLHNVAAFAVWLALFRRRPGWAAFAPAIALVGAAVLLSGELFPVTVRHGGLLAFGQRAGTIAAGLAPGLAPRIATQIAMTFIFLQSVHYTVWTSWIAQDCLPGQGTPTFRMTIRSARSDFGRVLLALVLCIAIAFAVLACWHLRQSVSWYLTLARAHVWFELAVLAHIAPRAVTARALHTAAVRRKEAP